MVREEVPVSTRTLQWKWKCVESQTPLLWSFRFIPTYEGSSRYRDAKGFTWSALHSPCHAPPSSASSLNKELPQVELELGILEALEFYPPVKLQGIHHHFVIFGLMEYLRRSLDRHFSPDEILQLLDRFYNLEMLKPDEEEMEILSQEEEFSLPPSFSVKDE